MVKVPRPKQGLWQTLLVVLINRPKNNRTTHLAAFVVTIVILLILLCGRLLLWGRPDNNVNVCLLLGGKDDTISLSSQKLRLKENNPVTTTKATYYNVNNIVKLAEPLVQSNTHHPQATIVTAYFQIRSKHSSDSYDTWIRNMLSLQDPMVIFCSPALISKIRTLRQHHAADRTVIIPMEIEDVPLAVHYNQSFWEHQFHIDQEAKIHQGYQVFWIWLSKTWWVNEAIRHNFFNSEVFVWSDMGCFRNSAYAGKTMVVHPEIIPRHSMLFMAHHPPNPPPQRIWNNKYTPATKPFFFTSGSIFAGYADTFQNFHQEFTHTTIPEFLKRDMFLGEDQLVIQSTCLLHPTLCAYIPSKQVPDNHYFGLRTALHRGGDYKLWYPPGLDQPLQPQ